MQLLLDFCIASFTRNDLILQNMVTPDFEACLAGSRTSWQGVSSWSEQWLQPSHAFLTLHINRILSHGKEGAIHAVATRQNGHEKHYAWFVTFQSAKGQRIKQILAFEH